MIDKVDEDSLGVSSICYKSFTKFNKDEFDQDDKSFDNRQQQEMTYELYNREVLVAKYLSSEKIDWTSQVRFLVPVVFHFMLIPLWKAWILSFAAMNRQ